MQQATTDIIELLTTPLSGVGPTLEAGDETGNAVLKIAQPLKRTDKIPTSLPPYSVRSWNTSKGATLNQECTTSNCAKAYDN